MDKNLYLKSMTAFGRGALTFPYGRMTVEIQSVNRRFLEVNVSLPRLLARFEMLIRNVVARQVGRGMVNVSLTWHSEAKQVVSVVPNITLAKGVKQAWEIVSRELGLEVSVPLSLIAQEKDILLFEEEIPEEGVFAEAIEKGVVEALDRLVEMKSHEGGELSRDLQGRLKTLEDCLQKVETKAPKAVGKYREKLTARLEELFSGSPENEERILREIAVYSERVDITEEIVRFKSHLSQFRDLLEKPLESRTETRGKTLDFLIQELNRETNTIGSKSSDKEVSERVVMMKGELEKMREQVQNIE